MNKKIKTLLVTGLLVIGMSGNVSALEPQTSTVANPQFEQGVNQRVIKLQDGKITVTIIKNDDGTYKIVTEWDSTAVKVTGLKSLFENGNINSNDFFNEEYHCHLVVKNGEKYSVTIDKLGEVPTGFNPMGELVKIEVTHEAVDKDGNGIADFKDDEPVTPPTEPENPVDPPVEEEPKEEIIDPETGDSSILAYAGIAVTSMVSLYVLNKKDEDK